MAETVGIVSRGEKYQDLHRQGSSRSISSMMDSSSIRTLPRNEEVTLNMYGDQIVTNDSSILSKTPKGSSIFAKILSKKSKDGKTRKEEENSDEKFEIAVSDENVYLNERQSSSAYVNYREMRDSKVDSTKKPIKESEDKVLEIGPAPVSKVVSDKKTSKESEERVLEMRPLPTLKVELDEENNNNYVSISETSQSISPSKNIEMSRNWENKLETDLKAKELVGTSKNSQINGRDTFQKNLALNVDDKSNQMKSSQNLMNVSASNKAGLAHSQEPQHQMTSNSRLEIKDWNGAEVSKRQTVFPETVVLGLNEKVADRAFKSSETIYIDGTVKSSIDGNVESDSERLDSNPKRKQSIDQFNKRKLAFERNEDEELVNYPKRTVEERGEDFQFTLRKIKSKIDSEDLGSNYNVDSNNNQKDRSFSPNSSNEQSRSPGYLNVKAPDKRGSCIIDDALVVSNQLDQNIDDNIQNNRTKTKKVEEMHDSQNQLNKNKNLKGNYEHRNKNIIEEYEDVRIHNSRYPDATRNGFKSDQLDQKIDHGIHNINSQQKNIEEVYDSQNQLNIKNNFGNYEDEDQNFSEEYEDVRLYNSRNIDATRNGIKSNNILDRNYRSGESEYLRPVDYYEEEEEKQYVSAIQKKSQRMTEPRSNQKNGQSVDSILGNPILKKQLEVREYSRKSTGSQDQIDGHFHQSTFYHSEEPVPRRPIISGKEKIKRAVREISSTSSYDDNQSPQLYDEIKHYRRSTTNFSPPIIDSYNQEHNKLRLDYNRLGGDITEQRHGQYNSSNKFEMTSSYDQAESPVNKREQIGIRKKIDRKSLSSPSVSADQDWEQKMMEMNSLKESGYVKNNNGFASLSSYDHHKNGSNIETYEPLVHSTFKNQKSSVNQKFMTNVDHNIITTDVNGGRNGVNEISELYDDILVDNRNQKQRVTTNNEIVVRNGSDLDIDLNEVPEIYENRFKDDNNRKQRITTNNKIVARNGSDLDVDLKEIPELYEDRFKEDRNRKQRENTNNGVAARSGGGLGLSIEDQINAEINEDITKTSGAKNKKPNKVVSSVNTEREYKNVNSQPNNEFERDAGMNRPPIQFHDSSSSEFDLPKPVINQKHKFNRPVRRPDSQLNILVEGNDSDIGSEESDDSLSNTYDEKYTNTIIKTTNSKTHGYSDKGSSTSEMLISYQSSTNNSGTLTPVSDIFKTTVTDIPPTRNYEEIYEERTTTHTAPINGKISVTNQATRNGGTRLSVDNQHRDVRGKLTTTSVSTNEIVYERENEYSGILTVHNKPSSHQPFRPPSRVGTVEAVAINNHNVRRIQPQGLSPPSQQQPQQQLTDVIISPINSAKPQKATPDPYGQLVLQEQLRQQELNRRLIQGQEELNQKTAVRSIEMEMVDDDLMDPELRDAQKQGNKYRITMNLTSSLFNKQKSPGDVSNRTVHSSMSNYSAVSPRQIISPVGDSMQQRSFNRQLSNGPSTEMYNVPTSERDRRFKRTLSSDVLETPRIYVTGVNQQVPATPIPPRIDTYVPQVVASNSYKATPRYEENLLVDFDLHVTGGEERRVPRRSVEQNYVVRSVDNTPASGRTQNLSQATHISSGRNLQSTPVEEITTTTRRSYQPVSYTPDQTTRQEVGTNSHRSYQPVSYTPAVMATLR